ncbi:MAG: hypothetical protein K2K48_01290 [Anaeroplasmataceae bacterium]|nr:hypothetical protein [Anaeroplasmataceae bacterium]
MGSTKNSEKAIKDKFAYVGKIAYDYSKEIKSYNPIIVLTKERENHILKRHPEMKQYIPYLMDYVNNPDFIKLDKTYNDTRNLIKILDEHSYLYITVKFSSNVLKKTSIISARYMTIKNKKKN